MQSGFFLLNCQHLSKYPVNPKKKKKTGQKEKEINISCIYILECTKCREQIVDALHNRSVKHYTAL